MDYLSIFVDIINDYLVKENITINQFSKRINVAERAVAKWMSMDYFPKIECVIKISDYFNCSIDYLFGLTNSTSFTRINNQVSFSNRFISLLKQNNITAYKVAKECHIGESAISKWNKGVCPKTETLITLAKYFSCSIDYLIGRS